MRARTGNAMMAKRAVTKSILLNMECGSSKYSKNCTLGCSRVMRNAKCVERSENNMWFGTHHVWLAAPAFCLFYSENGWKQAVATGNMTTNLARNHRVEQDKHGHFPDFHLTTSLVPGSNIDAVVP